MVEHRQAVIPLSIADSAGFDSFHSEENEQLIGQLKLLVAGDRVPPVMFLYGEAGSGKTHLMHICGEIAAANQQKHLYLSVDQSNPPPEFLIDIHGETLVCLGRFRSDGETRRLVEQHIYVVRTPGQLWWRHIGGSK